jgi:4-carboxymuconolactone decarboxylase
MKRQCQLFLLTALLLVAQNKHMTPFTGTWTMNAAKSRFNPGPPFKSFTLTFTADGTRHLDLIGAGGQSLKASLPWSDGKEVPVTVTQGGMENVTAVSKIHGRTFDDTWRANGKVIEKVHGAVSSDGKILTVSVEGTNNEGRAFHNRVVFDKELQMNTTPGMTGEDIRMVAPALDKYTNSLVRGDLWKRPDLSARDRSIVTVAALIARNQAIEMPYQFNLALDNGLNPGELSEIITHLAFYSGWGNAMSAVTIAKDIFAKRGIRSDQLPPPSGELLPINEAAEAQRAARVEQDAGPVAPGVVQYTSEVLFHELWLRPALAPRDRSLVTVSALIASGQVAQISYHLNRAMDNGLTRAQASETLTQLAFYAGWPNIFSAIPVVKGVFDSRPK